MQSTRPLPDPKLTSARDTSASASLRSSAVEVLAIPRVPTRNANGPRTVFVIAADARSDCELFGEGVFQLLCTPANDGPIDVAPQKMKHASRCQYL